VKRNENTLKIRVL